VTQRGRQPVNNAFYDALDERWWSAQDDPVALLRAESRLRNPWVVARMREQLGPRPARVLDVGCGAGFLTTALERAGHDVTGVDLSAESLAVARRHDASGRVRYLEMDAHALAFPAASFDVVCAMDLLEHTERPGAVIEQAARALRPGGLFFFHTFDRNPLSYLIVIKGVEWFVRNTPAHMHVYHLFLRPSEVRAELAANGLGLRECVGVRPRLAGAFWRMLRSGRVGDDFAFTFTRLTWMGYSGFAVKSGG
jgi:2-polyprenyl-6-hydroxyphenyl methylase / 3-demethylubiquinone-9 3-methyltransferase